MSPLFLGGRQADEAGSLAPVAFPADANLDVAGVPLAKLIKRKLLDTPDIVMEEATAVLDTEPWWGAFLPLLSKQNR